MELIKYKNSVHEDEWDQYVLNSNNGTMTNFPAGAFNGDTP